MNMFKLILCCCALVYGGAVYSELPTELKNFPKGCEPEAIGPKIAGLYLASAEGTTPIIYPEVCSWFGTLRFAGATQDKAMLLQAENRFIPILGENSGAMQTPNHVDNTVFGIIPLQLYIQTGKEEYLAVGLDFADRQWTMPDNPSPNNVAKYQALLAKGLSWQTRYWIDDMFMITAIQSQAYVATKDVKYINRAAHEMVAYLDSLQQGNGLFYHAPDAPFFWGRGNGWVAVGMADLLMYLPENNPNRTAILKEYRKMMATLKSFRNDEGLWNQLIDEPDVWTETSGSAMFTYAMAIGVKNGWLDTEEYAPVVRKAWLSLLTYMTEAGRLREVCEGTNIGYSKQYYVDRRRVVGDRHGQAAMIWCAEALYDRDNNSVARLNELSYDEGILSPAFHPTITEYTCHVSTGTRAIAPNFTASYGAEVSGGETVDLSSGTGKSVLSITSIDGRTTTVYTINYIRANDLDYSHLIINNDFELAPDANCNPVPVGPGIDGWDASGIPAWRPSKSSCAKKQFYGWTHDQSVLGGSTSQGINADAPEKHGNWAAWIGGSGGGSSEETQIEFHQTIDKASLEAGTYKVQCLLAVGSTKIFNQRLFANNKVQYFGTSQTYSNNLVDDGSEHYTFAGHTDYGESRLKEMAVYVTVDGNESLQLGLRTSNRQTDGSLKKQTSPMFRFDYFRLTKIDPVIATDARLAYIGLSAGALNFSPETKTYNVLLPEGTREVDVTALANVQLASVTGAGAVDVSSGSGVSVIKVIALDGVTTNTYTINYTLDSQSGIKEVKDNVHYTLVNRKLSVQGMDAYAVYHVNGLKVAEVRDNRSGTGVELMPGVYIVKGRKAFKIIVR